MVRCRPCSPSGGKRIALRLRVYGQADVVNYLHGDHLGSTSLTTNASGVRVADARYLPFGGNRPGYSNNLPTDYRFTGQRQDANIGLYDYGARFYDPLLGRFISADSLVPGAGNPQALNRYSYVFNNPLRYVDPSGHAAYCDTCNGKRDLPVIDIFLNPGPGQEDLAQALREYFDDHPDYNPAKDASLEYDQQAYASGVYATHQLAKAQQEGRTPSQPEVAAYLAAGIGMALVGRSWSGGHNSNGNCSFSADTLVSTASGYQAISVLQVGDQILAYDEKSDATGIYTVTIVWVHVDPAVVLLTIDDEQIETTPEHPFYTQERGWVAASDLWHGAHIRKADGSYGMVQALEVVQRTQPMYNLTVATAHTFFVGTQHWLVHNDCGGIRFAQKGISSKFRYGEFADQDIRDVAARVKAGEISPDQLPITYVERDGVRYTMNNRSLMVHYLAGTEPTRLENATGNPFFERQLTERLAEIGGDIGPGFLPRIR